MGACHSQTQHFSTPFPKGTCGLILQYIMGSFVMMIDFVREDFVVSDLKWFCDMLQYTPPKDSLVECHGRIVRFVENRWQLYDMVTAEQLIDDTLFLCRVPRWLTPVFRVGHVIRHFLEENPAQLFRLCRATAHRQRHQHMHSTVGENSYNVLVACANEISRFILYRRAKCEQFFFIQKGIIGPLTLTQVLNHTAPPFFLADNSQWIRPMCCDDETRESLPFSREHSTSIFMIKHVLILVSHVRAHKKFIRAIAIKEHNVVA